ncbi:MAG: sodium:proton antiporter [Fimbriimonadaceae bacterium]|nr:sodium:proton antiporter [Fimbriimonadaceae bacterium]
MLSLERIEFLLIIAAVVALIARRIRLPYTVGLVVAGGIMGAIGLLKGYSLTKELIFTSILPPLVFEAAFFLHWKELKKNLVPVLVLASVGVVISAAAVGFAMSNLVGWTLPAALIFGALIAATDPVSVIAMFKELKVKGRLRILVEAESLFNDGFAAVLFSILGVWAAGAHVDAAHVSIDLIREIGGGVICGAIVAGIALYLAGRTEDHLVELTFTAVAAFGSFLLAQHFHASGVLAVLVAGLMIGNLGHIGAITDAGREAVGAFWEFGAFVANSIVFLLIGVQEQALGKVLVENLDVIGWAILMSLVGRAASVYILSLLFRTTEHRIELPQQHVLFWGGLKGALALALAYGLPENLPQRDEIIAVAFGVVAFSVIVQGLTMGPLMARLGLLGERSEPSSSS